MSKLVSEIYRVTDEDVAKVREVFRKSEKEILADVEELHSWLQEQPHLPKTDKVRLEQFLLRNKFRVERTKNKLDYYYTLRGKHMDLMRKFDPTCDEMVTLRRSVVWAIGPVLTDKKERLMISRYDSKTADTYVLEVLIVHVLSLVEIALSHDYALGNRIVVDLSGLTMTHLKTLSVRTLINSVRLHQGAYSGRVLGIELINAPIIIKVALQICRLALPGYLYKKIKVHPDLESLYENVPKKCLPSELGGSLGQTSDELHEATEKMLLEMRDFLVEKASLVSNELLRPT